MEKRVRIISSAIFGAEVNNTFRASGYFRLEKFACNEIAVEEGVMFLTFDKLVFRKTSKAEYFILGLLRC